MISLIVGAVAKWLKCWIADTEVQGSSPRHGMEELSRSFFNHCFTPPRCNGYLALGSLSDGAGSSSFALTVNPMFKAEYSPRESRKSQDRPTMGVIVKSVATTKWQSVETARGSLMDYKP